MYVYINTYVYIYIYIYTSPDVRGFAAPAAGCISLMEFSLTGQVVVLGRSNHLLTKDTEQEGEGARKTVTSPGFEPSRSSHQKVRGLYA